MEDEQELIDVVEVCCAYIMQFYHVDTLFQSTAQAYDRITSLESNRTTLPMINIASPITLISSLLIISYHCFLSLLYHRVVLPRPSRYSRSHSPDCVPGCAQGARSRHFSQGLLHQIPILIGTVPALPAHYCLRSASYLLRLLRSFVLFRSRGQPINLSSSHCSHPEEFSGISSWQPHEVERSRPLFFSHPNTEWRCVGPPRRQKIAMASLALSLIATSFTRPSRLARG